MKRSGVRVIVSSFMFNMHKIVKRLHNRIEQKAKLTKLFNDKRNICDEDY